MKNRFKIHSLNKCVLNDHNVQGTTFGPGNTVVDWQDPVPAFMEMKIKKEEKTSLIYCYAIEKNH